MKKTEINKKTINRLKHDIQINGISFMFFSILTALVVFYPNNTTTILFIMFGLIICSQIAHDIGSEYNELKHYGE